VPPRALTFVAAVSAAAVLLGSTPGCASHGLDRGIGGPYPWIPDQRDGSYRNPIIFADYSDPDVLRVGDCYYLISSSFTATPALPILRSCDLMNWTIVGHAMENLPDARYAALQPGAGIWAPALRAHAGVFYIFAPTPDEGIYVLTAAQPEGPWSAPRLLVAGRGLIDPCPFWDDDGQAYLIHAYARSRAGIKDRLRLRPMAPDASRLLGEGQIVFSDPARHPTLEGPKLYKRNGWYYILAPAGGVTQGWQVALRSRHIFGPYEDRVVLKQGRTPVNGPHQGALVDTPGGQWWFVHFQDAGLYGRIVHLNPVTWEDDWPLMGGGGEPVLRHAKPGAPAQPIAIPQTSDDFDGASLSPQWQWHANHGRDWSDLQTHAGWLRLRALPLPPGGVASAPNLLLQKLPARTFTAETSVALDGVVDGSSEVSDDAGRRGDPRAFAGLIVVGESAAALVVEREPTGATAGGQRITLRIDDRVVFAAAIARGPVRLWVTMAEGGDCRFGFTPTGAGPAPQPQAINLTFPARPGRWVGAQIGLFAATPSGSPATTAAAYFDYLRFSAPVAGSRPLSPPPSSPGGSAW
jgi:hypothetical protein